LLCCVPCCAQVGVFSATLPPEALEITRKFMNKPVSEKFPACLTVHSGNFTVDLLTSCQQ
jgi:superfamily II DNA/RNA helicase